jgi:hypothetical protein
MMTAATAAMQLAVETEQQVDSSVLPHRQSIEARARSRSKEWNKVQNAGGIKVKESSVCTPEARVKESSHGWTGLATRLPTSGINISTQSIIQDHEKGGTNTTLPDWLLQCHFVAK